MEKTVPFDFPEFDLVETSKDNCSMVLKIEFDGSNVDYDFDVGGVMLHTVSPHFNVTQYKE